MPDNYISSEEFSRWVPSIDARLARHGATLGRIEVHLAEINGKTASNAAAITEVRGEITKVHDEDRRIESVVKNIHDHGCNQKHAHEQIIDALVEVGVLNSEGTRVARPTSFPKLSRKQKAGVGVGVGALLIPVLADLFAILHKIADWLTG